MNLESDIDIVVEHKFGQIRSSLWTLFDSYNQIDLRYYIMGKFRGIATYQILIEL